MMKKKPLWHIGVRMTSDERLRFERIAPLFAEKHGAGTTSAMLRYVIMRELPRLEREYGIAG